MGGWYRRSLTRNDLTVYEGFNVALLIHAALASREICDGPLAVGALHDALAKARTASIRFDKSVILVALALLQKPRGTELEVTAIRQRVVIALIVSINAPRPLPVGVCRVVLERNGQVVDRVRAKIGAITERWTEPTLLINELCKIQLR
jgi:hypothetical protein